MIFYMSHLLFNSASTYIYSYFNITTFYGMNMPPVMLSRRATPFVLFSFKEKTSQRAVLGRR